MGVLNPSSMVLILMAIIVVGASAKPSYTANQEDRLYNRRGWFDSVGETFNTLGDTLSDTVSKVGDTVSDWGEDIGVSDWDDAIVDTAGNVGDTLSDWGSKVADVAGDLADTVVDSVQHQKRVAVVDTVQHQKRDRLYNRRGWFDSVGETFNDLGDTLSDTASKVGDTVSDWGEDIGVSDWDDAIVDTASNVGDTLSDWGNKVADAAGDLTNTVVDSVQHQKRVAVVDPVQHQKRDRLYNHRGWFDSVGETFNTLGDALSDTASKVGDTVSDWGEDIGVSDWDDAIVDTAGNVGETLSDWGGNVANVAGDLADTVIDSVWHQKRFLSRESPEVFDPHSVEDQSQLGLNPGSLVKPNPLLQHAENSLLQHALSSGKGRISIGQPDPYSLEQFNSIENDPYSVEDHSIEDILRPIRPKQLAQRLKKRLYNRRGLFDT